MHQPRERGARERPRQARFEESPDSKQRKRHPRRRQHLKVRDRADPIRSERVREARHERRGAIAREFSREEKHPEARQHKRREKEQVVTEQRVPRDRVHRQDLQRLGGEVVGVGERQRMRIVDVGVPVPGERRQIAAEGA